MNPYQVLGVDPKATEAEIKKRYRKLARETHPDLNPGDEAAETRFKDISVAYEVLSDPDKRSAYDEFGDIALEGGFDAERARAARNRFGEQFGPAGGGASGEHFEFGGIEDLLRQFGGGGGGGFGSAGPGRGRAMRGRDIEAVLDLDLEEAARGGERQFSIERQRPDGSSAPETIKVRVPPGITDGGRLRIPGKGGIGFGGGPDGDLWLETRLRPHRIFRAKGRDLEFDLPLTLREATLGAEIEIPTLEEKTRLRVPPGTNSHSRLRLRGKGMPGAKDKPAGDLYARIKIIVPKEIDPALREALEASDEPDPREGLF